MKKVMKIFIILIVAISIINAIKPNIYASEDESIKLAFDILTKGFWGAYITDDTAIDIDIEIGTTDQIHDAEDFTRNILGYLQVLGSVISVIALVIIGLRYMFSAADEKAQMKGTLIYYVIGAVLVFATSNVLALVYNIFEGM